MINPNFNKESLVFKLRTAHDSHDLDGLNTFVAVAKKTIPSQILVNHCNFCHTLFSIRKYIFLLFLVILEEF